MRSKSLSILSALVFGLGLASLTARSAVNDIEPSKQFYSSYHIINPVVIDGTLPEWTGIPVLADPRFSIRAGLEGTPAGKGSGTNGVYVLFERYQGGDWTGPDDHTSAVQVAWDTNNVYFGFVVTDEYHENAANSAWNGDSVQLMIANSNRTTQVALYNYALGGVEGALGDVIIMHEAGPGGTQAVVARDGTTKKTTYEIKLPAASLGLKLPLKAGNKFGLGMAINDGDELTPGQKGWGGLGAHSIVFGKTPSQTALVTLVTNLPGSDRLFFSAINPTIDSFSFRATDKGTSIVDPTSAKLTIDAQAVALVASPKTGDAVDFTYTPINPFPGNTQHTYVIEVTDTLGNVVTSASSFLTPPYALLTAADKVTADTSKPGFIWNVHQNPAFMATDNSRPLLQLAGLLGENFADPSVQGPALAPGVRGANNRLPVRFEIETVINFDAAAAGSGDIVPDDQMPGVPGTSATAPTDGIAGEIITYLDLPVGKHTLIVNSDDGFRTTAGNISDIFLAQVAGEFPADRGAADTAYFVIVKDAGIYAFRTVWEQGGGDANIEWKSSKADGTEVLINDRANGGFSAYRSALGGPTAINLVSPSPGATGVSLDTAIFALIQEGSNAVDLNSVRLTVDGTPVNSQPTKAGNLITINYQPPTFLASASQHSAGITYTAAGVTRTESWTFTIEAYVTLTSAHQAVSVDKTKPGFIWRVFQNETVTPSTLAEAELALAGQLTDGAGQLLPNLADPAAVGIASGPGTVDGSLVKFEMPTVINLSQLGGDQNGAFTPDDQMPGIPGTNLGDDGIDAEILTFVEFPAGLVTMGVTSDDGFRTQAGYINKPADGLLLAEFEGVSATRFKFYVQDAGDYGLRTIWQEGGGGAHIELFTVKADGTPVLLNDIPNGGLKAYRVGVAPNKPASTVFTMSANISAGQVEITWTEPGVVLQESVNPASGWADLLTATSPYRPPAGPRPAVYYRLKK